MTRPPCPQFFLNRKPSQEQVTFPSANRCSTCRVPSRVRLPTVMVSTMGLGSVSGVDGPSRASCSLWRASS